MHLQASTGGQWEEEIDPTGRCGMRVQEGHILYRHLGVVSPGVSIIALITPTCRPAEQRKADEEDRGQWNTYMTKIARNRKTSTRKYNKPVKKPLKQRRREIERKTRRRRIERHILTIIPAEIHKVWGGR